MNVLHFIRCLLSSHNVLNSCICCSCLINKMNEQKLTSETVWCKTFAFLLPKLTSDWRDVLPAFYATKSQVVLAF